MEALRADQRNFKMFLVKPFAKWLIRMILLLELLQLCQVAREWTNLAKIFPIVFSMWALLKEHAVLMAAGMASKGFIPICAIYSTFLQRAYDPIIHDVCLQNLPVIFCLDRAGLSPNDGPTHHGLFDLSYLRCIPNAVVMQPRDENELRKCSSLPFLQIDPASFDIHEDMVGRFVPPAQIT